jgi:hypothetical protein
VFRRRRRHKREGRGESGRLIARSLAETSATAGGRRRRANLASPIPPSRLTRDGPDVGVAVNQVDLDRSLVIGRARGSCSCRTRPRHRGGVLSAPLGLSLSSATNTSFSLFLLVWRLKLWLSIGQVHMWMGKELARPKGDIGSALDETTTSTGDRRPATAASLKVRRRRRKMFCVALCLLLRGQNIDR